MAAQVTTLRRDVSIEQFSEDLRRYLDGLRPGATRKFLSRVEIHPRNKSSRGDSSDFAIVARRIGATLHQAEPSSSFKLKLKNRSTVAAQRAEML